MGKLEPHVFIILITHLLNIIFVFIKSIYFYIFFNYFKFNTSYYFV